MKYNKNLAGVQITDELINRSSSASARLAHDTILASTVVVRTAPAGGGTLLALTTDYTLGSEDARLTTEAGGTVNTTLAIVNGARLNTNLYVTYKTVGDYAEAEDVGLDFFSFNIASSNQSYTLPDPKSTDARGIRISWSGGNGTFKLTINGTINGYSSWEGIGNGFLTIYSNGTSWLTTNDGVYDRQDIGNWVHQRFINGTFNDTWRDTQTRALTSVSGSVYFYTANITIKSSISQHKILLTSETAAGFVTNSYSLAGTTVSMFFWSPAVGAICVPGVIVYGTWR
jgi:hypothetical protein